MSSYTALQCLYRKTIAALEDDLFSSFAEVEPFLFPGCLDPENKKKFASSLRSNNTHGLQSG